MQKKTKVCGHCRNHQKTETLAVSWSICMFFAFFCVFAFFFAFFAFFACFLRFGRPLFPGLHFFCILAGRGFQAFVFFAFWSSLGFGCACASHFAGSRPFQPKRMQSKIQAGQQTRKKRKQQMQKKCNTKKMQTTDAKKTQNLWCVLGLIMFRGGPGIAR